MEYDTNINIYLLKNIAMLESGIIILWAIVIANLIVSIAILDKIMKR